MKFSKRVMATLGLAPLLAGIATFGSCQTPPPVSQPAHQTVFIVLMENKNWVQIAGSSSAPTSTIPCCPWRPTRSCTSIRR